MPPDERHLVHWPEGREELRQFLLSDRFFVQPVDFQAELLRLDVLRVGLLVGYCAEVMSFPGQVEDEGNEEYNCRDDGDKVAVDGGECVERVVADGGLDEVG